MAILQVEKANTIDQWRITTNSLIISMNKLTDAGNTFQSNSTIILSGPGTALVVNNAATFGSANANSIQTTILIANSAQLTIATANGISLLNHANNAYTQANTGNTRAFGAFAQANAAFTQANTGNTTTGLGYITANTAWAVANTGNTRAFGAFAQANAAYTTANTANTIAGLAYTQANTANTIAGLAYTQANTGNTRAFGAFAQANAAYAAANTKFSSSGGTISGDVIVTGTLTTSSDKNLKFNILDISNATDTIKKMNGVEYNLLHSKKKSYGFIAQEIEKILPDIVLGEEGTKSLAYINIIAFLVEAVKELDERLTRLENGN